MQPSGRTPSSILRKRAADEQNQRRRSLRAKGGRRVSFAPDDELETRHLFQKDKNSPVPSQDTQPLAELQNQLLLPHQQMQQPDMQDHLWPPKPLEQQFDQAQHDQYLLQSPGLSPMSMELTNDTLQQQTGALVPFAANENDSFTFNAYAAAGVKDATHNITGDVPGLSTLVEEDEDEVYNDTSADGSAMELTGNTDAQMRSPHTDKSITRQSAAAAPEPLPTASTRSRRSSKQGAAAASPAPSEPLTSPRTRSRRSSTGSRAAAAAAAAAAEDADLQTPPAAAAGDSQQAQHGRVNFAPSMDPTPSPLRRITRSMSSPLAASPLAGLAVGVALDAAGDKWSRRSTLNRYADQQNKWGFVPGEEDTMLIDMDLPGAGGLGEATLHHVYSESAGTGELTMAVRQGQLPLPGAACAAAAGPPMTRAGGRRRSSVGRGRASLVPEVIPEEAASPAVPAAGGDDVATAAAGAAPAEHTSHAAPAGGDMTEDMAISPDCTPGLMGQRIQQQLQQPAHDVQHTPGAMAPGSVAAQDADGLTTNLLLDDRDIVGWGHVPVAPHTTGRGSVGSNVPTMHLRGAGHTTQLLADNTAGPQPLLRQSSAAAAPGVFGAAIGGSNAAALLARGEAAAAAAPAAVQYEDCTTKLLADSTAASACGVMGLFALPRPGLLGGTIAGGAPVVEPARQQEQQEYASPELGTDGGGARNLSRAAFGLPALPAFGLNAVPGSAGGAAGDTGNAGFAAAAAAPAGAAAADLSAAGCSLQGQGQRKTPSRAQHMRQVAAASPAGPAGMEQGSEPTLELAAAASQGGQTNALEDATLEDFELPPALAAGEERPITMPFSGPLCSLGNETGAPGSVARTPGGSLRQAQPITFTDFCQIVDMQFLTHIRRGTSISVMDFQPSSVPQDLVQALQLLSVTSSEVAVLEGAMHNLQSEMHTKRRDAYELEDKLGGDNPSVFAAVQTARHTQLEQTKHCLVLLKKICRSQTACSWKQLRQAMEQELAERLAQQQADLEEQLEFVQGKLQKANQQREYAKAFHADVLKKLAQEEAAQHEAAAARSRLASLRNRLTELQGMNADRRQRAEEVLAQVQELKTRCAEVGAEQAALVAKRDQLAAVVASTVKPAQPHQAHDRLCSAAEKLELLTGLQGWQPTAVGPSDWLISFNNKAGIRLSLTAGGMASVKLELIKPDAVGAAAAAAGTCHMGTRLLEALVAEMQGQYSFQVPTSQLVVAFSQAELALNRAVKLSEQCRSLFETQPLLAGVAVVAAEAGSSGGSAGGQGPGWLSFTLIAVEQEVKVNILLSLAGLLAGSTSAGIANKVEVPVSPDCSARLAVQQQLSSTLNSLLTGRGGGRNLLERVVVEATRCLLKGE